MNRANYPFVSNLTAEQLLDKVHHLHYLTRTNQHVPELKALFDMFNTVYRVRAVFTYLGFNGTVIWAGGQRLVWRRNKFESFQLGENVQLLGGNLDTKSGGTNHYPSVAHEGAWCELEFLCYGPPQISETSGWSMHVLFFEPLT